jgi:hypothetical protein
VRAEEGGRCLVVERAALCHGGGLCESTWSFWRLACAAVCAFGRRPGLVRTRLANVVLQKGPVDFGTGRGAGSRLG